MKFLGISGSLRRGSTNLACINAFRRHAPADVLVEISSDLATLPLFSPDREGDATPQEVLAFATRVEKTDGLIIASPEYAHGIPGALKNGLDWLVSRFEIPEKPVMLVHATRRGLFVRQHLAEVLRTMSTRLYDGPAFELDLVGKSPREAAKILDANGTPERIRSTLGAFAVFATQSSVSDLS